MKKAFIAVLSVGLMLVSGSAGSSSFYDALRRAPEGCEAVNPAQSTCTYKTTEPVDVFGGAAGNGSWIVKVKVKKKVTTYSSPYDGSPTGVQFTIPAGAKVTATARTAGSGVIVGGE